MRTCTRTCTHASTCLRSFSFFRTPSLSMHAHSVHACNHHFAPDSFPDPFAATCPFAGRCMPASFFSRSGPCWAHTSERTLSAQIDRTMRVRGLGNSDGAHWANRSRKDTLARSFMVDPHAARCWRSGKGKAKRRRSKGRAKTKGDESKTQMKSGEERKERLPQHTQEPSAPITSPIASPPPPLRLLSDSLFLFFFLPSFPLPPLFLTLSSTFGMRVSVRLYCTEKKHEQGATQREQKKKKARRVPRASTEGEMRAARWREGGLRTLALSEGPEGRSFSRQAERR